ncbi:MAG: helix-turn-helix domain-containing protein [Pirellulaceae bacterium]|nr:helix-turn-helix domain-containing protein [Pirellulaceae bacterium]
MAGKFIVLDDAAKMLGVTSEELTEMLSRREIFGYRDGASWKFKAEEIERVAGERGVSLGAGAAADAPLSFDDDFDNLLKDDGDDALSLDDSAEEGSSILVSDREVGSPEDSTSSTIIGAGSPADLNLAGEDSDLRLTPEGADDFGLGGSDVSLVADEGSDVRLASGGSDVLSGADSELKLASGSGTGDLGEELALESDALDLGSDVNLALDEDDDDLVLGASGTGSDVTLDAEGSGINLASPSDSGLSLEDEPLELAGSGLGSSLELPEDEDFISLEDMAGADEATQLKQDEEFLLAPSDDLGIDADDSDSGSQVIALEDSEAFDQEAATLLQPGDQGLLGVGAPAAMGAQPAGGMGGVLPLGPVGGAMPATGPAPVTMMPAELPEAPYSIWNVLSLLVIVMLMSLTGMLMMDLIRNMWSWEGEYAATTSIMDGIFDMLGFTR